MCIRFYHWLLFSVGCYHRDPAHLELAYYHSTTELLGKHQKLLLLFQVRLGQHQEDAAVLTLVL